MAKRKNAEFMDLMVANKTYSGDRKGRLPSINISIKSKLSGNVNKARIHKHILGRIEIATTKKSKNNTPGSIRKIRTRIQKSNRTTTIRIFQKFSQSARPIIIFSN